MRRKLDGVLLLDKPLEISSNSALQVARGIYRAEKAGHTGTLDPLASGLLPVCFGEATKYSGWMLDADKTYRATLKLGVTTTSGDAEGEVLLRRPVSVDPESIGKAITGFVGEISQVPPMHSALKHKGKPLYAYARAGVEIERAPRRVTIFSLTLESRAMDEMVISVRCSKGTYVRVLAEDLGEALGCGAHLAALERTGIGPFRIGAAHSLEALRAREDRDSLLLPVDVLLGDFPALDLDSEAAKALSCGRQIEGFGAAAGLYRLYDGNVFIGLGESGPDGRLKARRMMS